MLTDNGLVCTTRFAGGRRGRVTRDGFETEPARHGVEQENSSPNHPQTFGKVERLHQTRSVGTPAGAALVVSGAVDRLRAVRLERGFAPLVGFQRQVLDQPCHADVLLDLANTPTPAVTAAAPAGEVAADAGR